MHKSQAEALYIPLDSWFSPHFYSLLSTAIPSQPYLAFDHFGCLRHAVRHALPRPSDRLSGRPSGTVWDSAGPSDVIQNEKGPPSVWHVNRDTLLSCRPKERACLFLGGWSTQEELDAMPSWLYVPRMWQATLTMLFPARLQVCFLWNNLEWHQTLIHTVWGRYQVSASSLQWQRAECVLVKRRITSRNNSEQQRSSCLDVVKPQGSCLRLDNPSLLESDKFATCGQSVSYARGFRTFGIRGGQPKVH